MMTDQRPELPVAPPRAGNWQLSPENSGINGNSDGNQQATGDLKALAISRLAKIRGNKEGNQQATDELPGVQLPPPAEATEVANPEEGAGRLDWLDWIAAQVPLVKGDREYVWARLATLPPQAVERVARRYVETWQAKADRALAEMSPENRVWWAACEQKDSPWPIGPTNRGRDAANRTLLALVESGSWRHRRSHRKP